MTTDPNQLEVERLLSAWQSTHAARTSSGLEARILGRLQEKMSEPMALGGKQRDWATGRPHLWRGWAPIAATASLFCLFTGGLLVARESTLAAHRVLAAQSAETTNQAIIHAHQGKAAAAQSPAMAQDEGPETGMARLSTAAARRTPPAPLAAGHRRGRATAPYRVR